MLPTVNPERISTGIFFDWMSNASRWSVGSIKPFGTAELEVEALLMGTLAEVKLFVRRSSENLPVPFRIQSVPFRQVEVMPSHLLLGIWSVKESAGHKILASLGFDSNKASELDKSASVETGFFTGRTYNVYYIQANDPLCEGSPVTL